MLRIGYAEGAGEGNSPRAKSVETPPHPDPLPAGGEREKNYSPSTALLMMLRWISLEPP
jgi:hypothetical protein